MFDLVHKHKRVVQVILMLLVVPFAIWGVESYRSGGGGSDTVAEVNGLKISQRELENELRRQQDQLRRMLGRNYDPAVFDTPETRRTLLESLISQKLLASAAQQAKLTVSDEAIAELIHSAPTFQVDGQFSKARYETALRTQDPPMSPAQFEQRLRHDLALQQLGRAVADGAFAPRSVAARLAALETQKREISEVRFSAQQYLEKVKIDEAAVKAYYDANTAEFRTPERVRAEYVLLSADALAKEEQIGADEAKAFWDKQYGARFAERDKARQRIEAVLAEVKKDPAKFAEVAKRESADTASAQQGGDLGFQPRGSFVKPFEDALWRMKPGEISGIVESEFGFHVIRFLEARRQDGKDERRASHILVATPGEARPFAEMRPQIEAELRKQRASKRFVEAAEAFGNMVYEQPDSLKPAAERFKLPVRATPWIEKSANQELGPLDNPKLLAALFSADAIERKRNTDAIEVAPGTLVAARVLEHQPAAQRKFDEVKAQITDKLRRREAAELARKEGEAKLAELRKGGEAGLKWSAAKSVSRREPQGLPAEILTPIVSADVAKLPAYVGVPIQDAGYLLVRISKVVESAPAAGAQSEARAGQLYGAAQYEAFLASLRERADINIRKDALEKK
ncbi:MAG TPA: SurA N-terminal domain-containing protein [Burkholderiales bacterium]|nr:SurA N-terminal domain-containing protein [Burkholderiales bacterium]